jgi:hypothetical protein
MTRTQAFRLVQISQPEARQGLRPRFEQTMSRPSRLRALRAQRRDKRLAPQALDLKPAIRKPVDLPPGLAPAPSATPPAFPGAKGIPPHQEAPR